jgi:hypothetical protein
LPPPRPPSVEDEVLANIRAQAVGGHTIADFNLPEPFLRRVADRIIRATFIGRHRAVFLDRPEDAPTQQDVTAPEGTAAAGVQIDPYRASLAEERPVLRGFRVPVLDAAGERWPHTPADTSDAALAAATTHVAKRLAFDGLLATTVRAIELLGPARVLAEGSTVLRATGLPADLLAHFAVAGDDRKDIAEAIAERLKGGDRAGAQMLVSQARFAFRQSLNGFRIGSETGPVDSLRVHFTGAYYWGGRGAGGSLDVIRQLVTALPNAKFLAIAESRFEPGLREAISEWQASSRLELRTVPYTVSQWAQDNAKPGLTSDGASAVLIPRFASRGEQGPIHVPGDSFAAEALASVGMHVAQSPLLFQGGNILCVESKDGTRTLLVGEAEVHRNTALGLTIEQAQDALRIEFGADRILVLPAVSFHIDFDVLQWRTPEGTLAFVNDPHQAIPEVLRAGAHALNRAGLLAAANVKRIEEDLRAGRSAVAAKALAGPTYSVYSGAFPMSLAKHFSDGETDPGPPNLQRFVVALDMVISEMGRSPSEMAHAAAYLNSLRRMAADRRTIQQQLARHVQRVIPVPGISLDGWSFGYLNGLRDGDRYLMPAYSGIYAGVDAIARESFMKHLPPGSEVIPIHCAETQRRSGGLHCAASRH